MLILALFMAQDLFDGIREADSDAQLDRARLDRAVPALAARSASEVQFERDQPATRFDYAETLRDLFRRNVQEEFLDADTSSVDGSRLVELAYLSPTVYDAYKYYVSLSQLQAGHFFSQWGRLEEAAGDLPARRRARATLDGAQGSLYDSLARDPDGAETSVLEFVPSLTDAEREALREIVGDVVFTRDGLRTESLRRGGLLARYEQLRQEYERRWDEEDADLAPPGMPAPSEAEVRAIQRLPDAARRHAIEAVASAAALAEATMTAHQLAEALEAAELVADVDADVARELARMRAMLESQVRRIGEHAQAQSAFVAAQSAAGGFGLAEERRQARTAVAARSGASDRAREVEEMPRFGADERVTAAWEGTRERDGETPRRWMDGGGWGWGELAAPGLRIEIEVDEDGVDVEVDP